METTTFNVGGEQLTLHEIVAIDLVAGCEDKTYHLNETSPSWLAMALDVLVLEGFMEVVNKGQTWRMSDFGRDLYEEPEFVADINIFLEVAGMAPGFLN